jgi:hypothetical protein
LKAEISKYEVDNMSSLKDSYGVIGISTVKDMVPLTGSRISGLYLKECEESDFRVFEGMEELN